MCSDWLLPELIAAKPSPPDLVIRRHPLDALPEAVDGGDCFAGKVEGVGRLLVEHGRTISVDPVAHVDDGLLRTVILGPVLSVLLRQRGLFVLHASCVILDGHAVAFIGASGMGKSTMAEAFYAQGYSVLTDDVTAIEYRDGRHWVIPGYPQIKLLPDSAQALVENAKALPRIYGHALKHTHRIVHDFPDTPVPLTKIFLLDRGDAHHIEPLAGQTVFPVVLANARAATLLKTSSYTAEHLRQCTRLLSDVPVARLRRKYDLQRLPDLVDLVAAHVQAQHASLPS